jgi:hypothetical protein
MNVTDFLDYMKEEFSSERMETNENNFFEYFFYYKRNIRDFLTAFKTYNPQAQKQIITFLLHIYPLSDNFLAEILKEMRIELNNEIMIDTINYISSAFVEEIGELNIDFDEEIKKNFKKSLEIRDIIDFNEAKMNKLLSTKKEFSALKEKDEKLAKDIKELENGNINALKEEIFNKQKLFDELKTEKSELNKQFEKLKLDLAELNRYGDLKEQVAKCREIIKELNLPKDYTDKKLMSDV